MQCTECGTNIASNAVFCPYCGARIPGAQENEEFVYEAFISYKHSDVDRKAALRIQRSLEGAAIPKELQTPERGNRLGRLFRDEDELTAADSLPGLILDALNKSRFLIVLCSPRSQKSEWVQREVETFAQLHGRNRVLTVLVDGEPEESFPPLMLTRMERDSETGTFAEVRAEPLAADLRKASRKDANKEIARLEATILGCGLDDLQQRLRMRRLRMNAAISVALMLVSFVFGGFALYQRFEIQANLRTAQINESRILARESQDQLAEADRYGALQTALKAMPNEQYGGERPLVPDAQLALERALGIFPRTSTWYGYLIDSAGARSDCRDGVIAHELYGNSVMVCDVETGMPRIKVYPTDENSGENAAAYKLSNFKLGNGTIACAYGKTGICFDYNTREALWHSALPGTIVDMCNVLYLETTGQFVFVAKTAGKEEGLSLLYCDEQTGECVRNVAIGKPSQVGTPILLAASADEQRVAVAVDRPSLPGSVLIVGRDVMQVTADTPQTATANPYIVSMRFDGDELAVASVSDLGSVTDDLDIAFESFDNALSLRWISEEKDGVVSVANAIQMIPTIKVLGVATNPDDMTEHLVTTIDDRIELLDNETGDATFIDYADAPLAAAALFLQDDEVCVAGCTNEAKVYLRHPFTRTARDDEAYTTSFSLNVSKAYPIFDGETFGGFVAWTSEPPSYHVLLLDDDIRDERPRIAEEVSGEPIYDGVNLVTLTDDAVSLIDNNTFEKLWSTPLSSLALGHFETDDEDPLISLTDSSVLICNPNPEKGDGYQIRLCELSIEDGSVVNTYRLPWSANAEDYQGRIEELTFCEDSQRRLVAISDADICAVYDLDALVSVLETASDEDGSAVLDIWLSPRSLITRSSSAQNWATFRQYSLDTGEELDESTALVGMATLNEGDLADFATEDRRALAVKCFDGVIRAYSTADGSVLWESDDTLNASFLVRVSSDRLLVQESSGRCHLLNGNTGKVICSSEVKLPPLDGCNRLEDGYGLAVLYYTLQRPYEGNSLVTFSLNEDDAGFGPIGELNYGVCISKNGEKALVKTPWSEEYRIYDRPSPEQLIVLASEQIDISKGLVDPDSDE